MGFCVYIYGFLSFFVHIEEAEVLLLKQKKIKRRRDCTDQLLNAFPSSLIRKRIMGAADSMLFQAIRVKYRLKRRDLDPATTWLLSQPAAPHHSSDLRSLVPHSRISISI